MRGDVLFDAKPSRIIFRSNEAWRGETRLCFGPGAADAWFRIMELGTTTQPRAVTSCPRSNPATSDQQHKLLRLARAFERCRRDVSRTTQTMVWWKLMAIRLIQSGPVSEIANMGHNGFF